MTYTTLFDAQAVPYSYATPAIFAGAAVLAAGWMYFSWQRHGFGIVRATRHFLAFGFAMVLLFVSIENWSDHLRIQRAAAGDGSNAIEGIIQDHWVKERVKETNSDIKVETIEHFRISTVEFEYIQTNSLKPYFTNASGHEVDLRDGMRVRIAYLEDSAGRRIVRLETAQ